MNAATLSQPLLMAGGAVLGTVGRAGQWTFARYMRAPLASTGLLAMVTMTALAGSNALYFQTAVHPSPFFAPARDAITPVAAPVPTAASERPAADVLPRIEQAAPDAVPEVSQETTGTISAPIVVPDEPVGNATMFAVQKKLYELNLFSGQVDGYYGPKTAEAIRAFEVRNGMPATGEFDQAVMDAIIASDGQGRVSQPAARQVEPQAVQAAPIPATQPAPVQVASAAPVPVAAATPQQDQIVARLPALSPAEQAFDNVAQSAANTIDSIIANVDAPRSAPAPLVNPPTPRVEVASAPAPTQPMPEPVVQTVRQTAPAAAPAPAVQQAAIVTPAISSAPVRPATDEELVSQIQRGLASLGFYHGQIDGRPSTETARAIREFENFHRYRMTGQVQPDLVDLLVKAGATI